MESVIKAGRKLLKEERGAETVELVCLIPIEILVFSIFLTFAQIIFASNVALNAAAAGARTAILQVNGSEAKFQANLAATTYLQGMGMGVEYLSDALEYESWRREALCEYSVTVKIRTLLPVPFYGGLKNEYQVTQGCSMLVEKE